MVRKPHRLIEKNLHLRPLQQLIAEPGGRDTADILATMSADVFTEKLKHYKSKMTMKDRRRIRTDCVAAVQKRYREEHNAELGPIAVIVLGNLIWYLIKELIL